MTTTRTPTRRHVYGCPCSYCPRVELPCGCKTGSILCEEASRLWDKVNAANKNLMRTRRAVETWDRSTLHMFASRRIKIREAIYEWRRGEYDQHFGLNTKTVKARVRRKLAGR